MTLCIRLLNHNNNIIVRRLFLYSLCTVFLYLQCYLIRYSLVRVFLIDCIKYYPIGLLHHPALDAYVDSLLIDIRIRSSMAMIRT